MHKLLSNYFLKKVLSGTFHALNFKFVVILKMTSVVGDFNKGELLKKKISFCASFKICTTANCLSFLNKSRKVSEKILVEQTTTKALLCADVMTVYKFFPLGKWNFHCYLQVQLVNNYWNFLVYLKSDNFWIVSNLHSAYSIQFIFNFMAYSSQINWSIKYKHFWNYWIFISILLL